MTIEMLLAKVPHMTKKEMIDTAVKYGRWREQDRKSWMRYAKNDLKYHFVTIFTGYAERRKRQGLSEEL